MSLDYMFHDELMPSPMDGQGYDVPDLEDFGQAPFSNEPPPAAQSYDGVVSDEAANEQSFQSELHFVGDVTFAEMSAALAGLLEYTSRHVCQHKHTHVFRKTGVEVCECGARWLLADGGKPSGVPEPIARAESALGGKRRKVLPPCIGGVEMELVMKALAARAPGADATDRELDLYRQALVIVRSAILAS